MLLSPAPHTPAALAAPLFAASCRRRTQFVADSRGELVVLGTGTHAVVYLAVLRGQRVAVKVRGWVVAGARDRVQECALRCACGLLCTPLADLLMRRPNLTQAFELGAGIDSGQMWQEVALLRNCQHPRVVQLLGVAVEVRAPPRQRGRGRALRRLAHALLPARCPPSCAAPITPPCPPLAATRRVCAAGRAAAGGDAGGGARQPGRPAARPGNGPRAALGRQVRCLPSLGPRRRCWPTRPAALPCPALPCPALPCPLRAAGAAATLQVDVGDPPAPQAPGHRGVLASARQRSARSLHPASFDAPQGAPGGAGRGRRPGLALLTASLPIADPCQMCAGGARWRWTWRRRWPTCTPSCTCCTRTSRPREPRRAVPHAVCSVLRCAALRCACTLCARSSPRRGSLPARSCAARSAARLATSSLAPPGPPRRSNVLISADWRASVSDLGMAQVLAGSARTAVGFSRVYAAPEQLLGQRCTLAADMYSFGVLLAFLTTARHGDRRGEWRMPEAPEDCPEARALGVECAQCGLRHGVHVCLRARAKMPGCACSAPQSVACCSAASRAHTCLCPCRPPLPPPLAAPQEVVALIAACISADPTARPTAAEALQRLHEAPA